MGGRPGWEQGACSAGGGAGGACVCAASERSEQVVPSPGLGRELHVDRESESGNPWEWAARCGRPAERPGADTDLPPG